MSDTKRYWMDLGDLHQQPEAIKGREHEFSQELAIDQVVGDPSFNGASSGRRDFLKFLGFGLGAATLAACETPVIKSIPYVNKPEDITPGVANWYASTFYDGEDFASILVKTREGRPIHIKGNPRFGLNRNPALAKGSINARINSSVLSLYDNERLKQPMMKSGEGMVASNWSDADDAITKGLAAAAGKRVVILTNTLASASSAAAIEQLRTKFPTVEHVQMDTISYSGIINANLKSFGKRVFPSYDLTKADVIVSVDADFLSNWGSTTQNAWQYSSRRDPAGKMSRHFQFEARMSLSGANADVRVPMKVSELPAAVVALHAHIAKATGGASSAADAEVMAATEGAAKALLAARGNSVVIAGSNNEGVQVLVNSINSMLGNYGSTIDLNNHSYLWQGDDVAVAQLVKDMNAGAVGALFIGGVNPAYSLHNAAEFKAGLAKVGLSVSFSGYADETASLCSWICPDHHYLESWNDFMPKAGHYTLAQPVITPLFSTRQWQESLLRWSGSYTSYYSFIRENWQRNMAAHGGLVEMFADTWNQAVHDGVYEPAGMTVAPSGAVFAGDVSAAAAMAKASKAAEGEFELALYTTEAIGSGKHANNPWLQEMPIAHEDRVGQLRVHEPFGHGGQGFEHLLG
ncbi:MAG: TAT-variant-translocated molybdopterin oxidoreductase [Flavobacteriales bacterium]